MELDSSKKNKNKGKSLLKSYWKALSNSNEYFRTEGNRGHYENGYKNGGIRRFKM